MLVNEDDLRWVGLAVFDLLDPARRELAAVYDVVVLAPPLAHPTEELIRVGWIDLGDAPSDASPLDLAIARGTTEPGASLVSGR